MLNKGTINYSSNESPFGLREMCKNNTKGSLVRTENKDLGTSPTKSQSSMCWGSSINICYVVPCQLDLTSTYEQWQHRPI